MKKFLIGLVAGVLLAGLTGVVVLFSFLRMGERRPTVSDGTTLVLRLSGDIPERAPIEYPLPFLEYRTPATVFELWAMLDRAANDSRIRAVALYPEDVQVGWARLQEIRDSLRKFRASGKPLVAYLRRPSGRDYYLASVADHVYMSREDLLNLKGLRAEVIYLRGTLDKLGIEAELEHAGKYKDAGDMFTRSSMSPETREVLNSVLDLLYDEFVRSIAQARGKKPDEIRAVLDEGPFLASQALDKGLIDGTLYEDEMLKALSRRLNQDKLEKLSHLDYVKALDLAHGSGSGKRIAMVVAEGDILSGGGGDGLGDEAGVRSGSFIQVLRRVREDKTIEGVILRINSPGGDAIASDEILREVKLLSEAKPMVISMSDDAASGGYFIAMTGDPVIAYPSTFTGSIGVLYGKFNLHGLYDKLGIQKDYLTRGRFANVDSDYTPLDEASRAKLREGLDSVYSRFLAVVAAGRHRQVAQIAPVAEGRVWLGAQAIDHGLVDELGGLDSAVDRIREKLHVASGESIRLVPYPRQRSLLELLLNRGTGASAEARLGQLLHTPAVELLRGGGILKWMPYTIRVE